MTDIPAPSDEAVEAACAASWGAHHWPRVPNADQEREYARRGLAAGNAVDWPRREAEVRAVTLREVIDWLEETEGRRNPWIAQAVEARFNPDAER